LMNFGQGLEQRSKGVKGVGSPEGLQAHIDTTLSWCARYGLTVSPTKSTAVIFSSRAVTASPVNVDERPLPWSSSATYVGVDICQHPRHLFCKHMLRKCSQVTSACNVLLTMRRYCDDLSPHSGLTMFKALVDPHLIHASDVFLTSTTTDSEALEAALNSSLRRIFRVHSRAPTAVLLYLSRLTPIRYRRLSLALRALSSFLLLPNDLAMFGAVALAFDLAQTSNISWIAEIQQSLTLLLPGRQVSLVELRDPAVATILAQDVEMEGHRQIALKLRELHSLYPLLHTWFPSTEQLQHCPPRPAPIFRLKGIKNPPHRWSFLHLLIAQNHLAVAKGRLDGVERQHRVCPVCRSQVEDEWHFLFVCTQVPEYAPLRAELGRRLTELDLLPFDDVSLDLKDWTDRWISWVSCDAAFPVLARWIHAMFRARQLFLEAAP